MGDFVLYQGYIEHAVSAEKYKIEDGFVNFFGPGGNLVASFPTSIVSKVMEAGAVVEKEAPAQPPIHRRRFK